MEVAIRRRRGDLDLKCDGRLECQLRFDKTDRAIGLGHKELRNRLIKRIVSSGSQKGRELAFAITCVPLWTHSSNRLGIFKRILSIVRCNPQTWTHASMKLRVVTLFNDGDAMGYSNGRRPRRRRRARGHHESMTKRLASNGSEIVRKWPPRYDWRTPRNKTRLRGRIKHKGRSLEGGNVQRRFLDWV